MIRPAMVNLSGSTTEGASPGRGSRPLCRRCALSASTESAPLRQTPLHELHLRRGARMVGFAGYEMPAQYPTGIIAEHLHTSAKAGLFEVSHLGQIRLRGAEAARARERLVPGDLQALGPGRM